MCLNLELLRRNFEDACLSFEVLEKVHKTCYRPTDGWTYRDSCSDVNRFVWLVTNAWPHLQLSHQVSWSDQQKEINNWRTYSVCDINSPNVRNWLRTPYIDRRQASRLYIEMKFSMRDCTHSPGVVRSCKETFDLRAFESDFDFAR